MKMIMIKLIKMNKIMIMILTRKAIAITILMMMIAMKKNKQIIVKPKTNSKKIVIKRPKSKLKLPINWFSAIKKDIGTCNPSKVSIARWIKQLQQCCEDFGIRLSAELLERFLEPESEVDNWFNSVPEETKANPKQLIDELISTFEKSDKEIRLEIDHMKKLEGETVQNLYNKLIGMNSKLPLKRRLRNEDLVHKFISILILDNDEYDLAFEEYDMDSSLHDALAKAKLVESRLKRKKLRASDKAKDKTPVKPSKSTTTTSTANNGTPKTDSKELKKRMLLIEEKLAKINYNSETEAETVAQISSNQKSKRGNRKNKKANFNNTNTNSNYNGNYNGNNKVITGNN